MRVVRYSYRGASDGGPGRGKRTTVARLTFKGVLEAVRIFPDYTPDFRLLIAETDLRAMLAQAAVDHTPLALQVAATARMRRHGASTKPAARKQAAPQKQSVLPAKSPRQNNPRPAVTVPRKISKRVVNGQPASGRSATRR